MDPSGGDTREDGDFPGGRYARDRHGNETYPPGATHPFARNESGEPYYARDARGNELYPLFCQRCVVIWDEARREHRPARDAEGNELYPTDRRGNEYYLTRDGRPFLLRRADGTHYLARSRKGLELIPWNHVADYITQSPLIFGKDSAGNLIYMHESDMPESLKCLIRCICRIAVVCPKECLCRVSLCV